MDNTTKCSVFRTFQGWTALSDMLPGQGLLHVVPIPEAMAYVLLRPLLDDVPEDEICRRSARKSVAGIRAMASTVN
ncbi:YbiU family protein [Escherichia coli]